MIDDVRITNAIKITYSIRSRVVSNGFLVDLLLTNSYCPIKRTLEHTQEKMSQVMYYIQWFIAPVEIRV